MNERDIEYCSAHPDHPTDGDPCPTCGSWHPLSLHEDRDGAAWVVCCWHCGWSCEEPW
jgi:hypothetical protein